MYYKTLKDACKFEPKILSGGTFEVEGRIRKRFIVTRPNGNIKFLVIQYEDGYFSNATELPRI